MKIELSSPMLEAITASRMSLTSGFTPGVNGESGVGFAQAMKHAVSHMDGQQHAAHLKVSAVESGQSDDLIGAMLASQEANLSFSMMMQVRNKLMAAFDDIIKMQV
ncbi:flagellar hook-basal body complex protein FliE [Dyella sp. M7H15-1]|uniref:flagellar hook-basal body complex protein FliE n=1 Tax=Dyella sp. M7H15-1 TaxID=2501295 RepID=UPI001004F653|nr:flagellar hook-basal body complex protein FliE [Dyella sp. M7H15-1]QAU24302.1 flagellar hook-basal body complex protein FliE [Dyella sp. M7H15-1]